MVQSISFQKGYVKTTNTGALFYFVLFVLKGVIFNDFLHKLFLLYFFSVTNGVTLMWQAVNISYTFWVHDIDEQET